MKVSNNIIRGMFWSLFHAILLALLSYLLWNIPSDWTNSGKWLQRIHLAKAIVAESDTLPNDVVLINTCYDHMMITAYDEIGLECGQIDITNRAMLIKLLQYLASTNEYRYIVCDIEFDKKLKSDYDNQLYSLIEGLPRCVVPRSSDCVSIPERLYEKSAVSEFHTNVLNSNFLKYLYVTNSGESMALRMARDMDNITIDKFGPFYLINGKVCLNAHILDIKTNITSEYQQSKINKFEIGNKNILQLGTDVLPMIDANVKGLFSNKIIMIGDFFLNDIHTTVAGPTPGIMIIYNAYHALIDRKNVPSIGVWISLIFIYFLFTFFILHKKMPCDLLPPKMLKEHPVLCKIIEWIILHALFTIVGLSSFLCAKTYIDAWILATYFTIFESVYPIIVKIEFKSIKIFN